MNIGRIIDEIYDILSQFIPLFRYIWAGTIILGFIVIGSTYLVYKGSERKKLPMVLYIVGALMVFSSSAQLIVSFI